MAGEANELSLGDLVTLTRGTTYQSALLGQPGPVLLGLASIKRNGGFRDDNLKTYGGECPAKLTLRPGDIFVSLKDVTQAAELLGSIARVPPHIPAGRVTQDTVKLTFTRDDIPSRYIYWLLRTPIYREYCRAHAIGTTNLALPREDFLAFPIPRPKAREMTLVEVLDALDDKIELNRRMNATLEAMARALFQSWFVDFDPVRAKMEGRDPGLPKEIADLFPSRLVDSELGPIPDGWRTGPIGTVVDCVGGSTPSTAVPEYWNPPTHCWATPKDLSRLNTSVLRSTERKVSPSGLAKISSGLLPTGTVLMSSRAPVGYLAIAAVPTAINQGFIALKATKQASTCFLLEWCRSHLPEIRSRASGTTFPEISKQNFRQINMCLPCQNLMSTFTGIVEPLLQKVGAADTEASTLVALRDTLLPKLISGELCVSASLGSMQEVST